MCLRFRVHGRAPCQRDNVHILTLVVCNLLKHFICSPRVLLGSTNHTALTGQHRVAWIYSMSCLKLLCTSEWLTFMFFLWSTSFLHLLGGFHEKRKDGPQAQDVHKLMAVICSLWADHPMVQDLQSAGSGHFLLSAAETGNRQSKILYFAFVHHHQKYVTYSKHIYNM